MVRTNPSKRTSRLSDALQEFIATQGLKEGARLPAERDLATMLGLSRGALRQLLATAEARGQIWRQVGKGTFVGTAAATTPDSLACELASRSNPVEVLEVRALLEPRMAALAALRGTPRTFGELAAIVRSGLAARDAATAHRLGNQFHEAIAAMAGNELMRGLFDAVFRVREMNTWGKLRPAASGMEDLSRLWKQHAAIAEAIAARDAREAAALMHQHIDELQRAISGQDARLAAEAGRQQELGWMAGL